MTRAIPSPEPAPPRWLPDAPLPPYRYVPGLHPHPFRSPAGHLWAGGAPPREAPWDPRTRWAQDPRWLRTLDLFNHRFFWEAHEAWEGLWHAVPRESPLADLLQGLIQASAFALKHHMGQATAADHLLHAARRRLDTARAAGGTCWRGIDLGRATASLDGFSKGGPWPVLALPT